MKGLFITFEGIEGSGKTTQITRLATYLAQEGYPVVTTREPGGTHFGEQIRNVLLSVNTGKLCAETELFLYLASRTQHLHEIILPSLRTGKIVLCDRFSDATLAYQGSGRRLADGPVKKVVAYAAQGIQPDLTLLLDLDVEKGLSRVQYRGTSNRLDRESLQFHQRVRRGYLKLARSEPRRIRMVDASEGTEIVASIIQKKVSVILKRYQRRLINPRLHVGKRTPK